MPLDWIVALVLVTAPAHADVGSQLVVRVRPPAAARSVAATRAWLERRALPLGVHAVGTLADGEDAAPVAAPGNPFDLDPASVWLLEAESATAAVDAVRALAGDPAFEWVEPNREREALEFPNDPMFQDSRQWGLDNRGPASAYGGVTGADIRARGAWAITTGSNDVRLAIADTGLDPNHPEFHMTLPGGLPRVFGGVNVSFDSRPTYADSLGHGTAVAGVMAALTNEGPHFDSLGVAGVCGGDGVTNAGCRLIPIRITGERLTTASSWVISRAIVHAVALGARAINLSFGGGTPSELEREALYYAITRGSVVVAASGNSAVRVPGKVLYPAAFAAEGLCVSVGASDPTDRRTIFSSWGPGLDVVAPGTDVWTCSLSYPSAFGFVANGYVPAAGTSLAAPFVTGTIGLLVAARPELEDTDHQNLIRLGATDLAPPGPDLETGWGRLDAARTLALVGPQVGIWHDEVAPQAYQSGPVDSLVIGGRGPGTMDRVTTWAGARVMEARATVAIPDSFLRPVEVWPRVGGSMTVRGDFHLPFFAPWSEVIARDDESFTLRGFLYELTGADDPARGWLPLPPDQARFGFTVIGAVDRPPALALAAPTGPLALVSGDTIQVRWTAHDADEVTAVEVWLEADGATARLARVPGTSTTAAIVMPCPPPFRGAGRLRVTALDEHGRQHDATSATVTLTLEAGSCRVDPTRVVVAAPNPFERALELRAAAGTRLVIFDTTGRSVRERVVGADAAPFVWDGADRDGRRLPSGLYFVRADGARGRALVKVVKR